MRTTLLIACLTLAAAMTPAGSGHGTCAHEGVHTYGGQAWTGVVLFGPGGARGIGFGYIVVADSETADCDGDGEAWDSDGDFDLGYGGGMFGHGPWATHCGFHQEAAGTVTVTDLTYQRDIAFVTASGDTNSWVPDPVTGENTCMTDGVISPGTDPEGDDCISAWRGVPPSNNPQEVVCPGGGDGALWVYVLGFAPAVGVGVLGLPNPATVGIITSP